jgi:hypothetical protein
VSCAITKPREGGGHSPRWAAEPEKIIIIIIIIIIFTKTSRMAADLLTGRQGYGEK